MARTSSQSQNRRKRKPRFYKKPIFWLILLLPVVAAGIAGSIAYDHYTEKYRVRAEGYDLSKIGDVELPSIIIGRDGNEIGRVFVQNRSVIGTDQIPENFINALRAGEDKRFYRHNGVDYVGIARAALDWWRTGEAVSGASTITQQLARGAYALEEEREKYGEKGLERKLVEAFLAQRIEKAYSKEEIIGFYLNLIYFGSGYYGLRSASLGYFGKEPKELSMTECATIVGLIKNPTGLSPLNNIKASTKARNMVIDRMVRLRILSTAEGTKMKAAPIRVNPKPLRRGTSHLYERIAGELRYLLGEEAIAMGGYTIETSIDSRAQAAAEGKLIDILRKAEENPNFEGQKHGQGDSRDWLQGAVFMVDHRTGGVIAHVGGRDYAAVPYDMIEQGSRPLGTAFQPFVYATAFENGMTPADLVDDEPMDNRSVMVGDREGILGEWGMETDRPRYEGKIRLRRALEASKVAAGVRVARDDELENVVKTAKGFGFSFEDVELLPRIAVGWEPVTLRQAVRAYAAFAKAGSLGPAQTWYVKSIRNAQGNLIYERSVANSREPSAISDATAFQIHNIMQGGMRHGSSVGVLEELKEAPFHGACKTGTTHNFSDNWTLGYNGRVSCGVWIGYLSSGHTIYDGAFSRDLSRPVWVATMNAAAADFGGRGIPQPSDIVEQEICSVSGGRITPYCYEISQNSATGESRSTPTGMIEYFRKGTEKIPYCPIHSGSSFSLQERSSNSSMLDMMHLAAIDTTPVRAKEEILAGEDPYGAINGFSGEGYRGPIRGQRSSVFDSFGIEDSVDRIELPKADRLDILPE